MKNAALSNLPRRKFYGNLFRYIFFFSVFIGITALCILLLTIFNNCFGYVAVEYAIRPASLSDRELASLPAEKLLSLLQANVSKGLYRRLASEQNMAALPKEKLLALLKDWVLQPSARKSWSLWDSLFKQESIRRYMAEENPGATLEFRSWLTPGFLIRSQNSSAEKSGIRTAILGSLWMIVITILIAFPLGIATAIYLEEYTKDNRLNRIIQVNIYNLSGVPSIIYGLLGLAVFVRILEPLTSGNLFSQLQAILSNSQEPASAQVTSNGRTILSAGLTLALLILPVIIINAQEALRAVPKTLRYSSYGLGATKWQTIWYHILPGSIDRILTGTILAISRGIGETAPLVVIGASTFITIDPVSIFSKFTTLPIQIYQWTARPQGVFKNIAAAAIIVLLILLVLMNGTAILMRNHFAKKRRVS